MHPNTKEPEPGEVAISARLRPEQVRGLDELAARTYRRRSDILRMAVDAILQADAAGTLFPAEADPDLARRNPVQAPDLSPEGKEAA